MCYATTIKYICEHTKVVVECLPEENQWRVKKWSNPEGCKRRAQRTRQNEFECDHCKSELYNAAQTMAVLATLKGGSGVTIAGQSAQYNAAQTMTVLATAERRFR
jgi:hypothetical protein